MFIINFIHSIWNNVSTNLEIPQLTSCASGLLILKTATEIGGAGLHLYTRHGDENYLRSLHEPDCGGLKDMDPKKLQEIMKRTSVAIEHLEKDRKAESPVYRRLFVKCFHKKDYSIEGLREVYELAFSKQNQNK